MSPELEAGVPTLDVEGVQGRAPDGEALLDVNMGKPHLNKPVGTLKTQVSGPDTFTDVDLGKPSYDLDLPSSKRKSAKCFSCASSGDRDEPYIKGKSNVGIGLNTPDRKAQDVKLSTGKPDLKLPSRDFDGPDGHMEMKAGRNFDMSGSGPEIRDPDVGDTQKEYGLRGSAPDVDIGVDHGRYNGDASLPTEGVAPKGPGLGPSSAEIDLPSGKKKIGNCLTCTASGKKDEPYRKARKNYGYEFEGQDVDGSIEMKRLSGPSTDASGPDVNISKKRPGAKLDTGDVDSPEARLNTEISGPNAKLSSGRVKGPSASGDVHSPEVDFPSAKKKSGSCFSCVGSGDKDEPYRTNRGKTDFSWNPPEVDGSLKMEKPDELDISGSGPGFSGRGEKKDLGYQVTGPDFNVHGPNKGISTEIPKMAVDTAYPHVKSADVPSGNMSAGISGPEIDLSGPSADVPDRDFTIKGPKGDFSGPKFDASRPKAGVSGPEIDLSGPSPDLPKGDINIKGLKGDFSGPKFDVNRPKGGVSRPEMDLRGPSADVSKGDFNVRGPKGVFPGPEFDARRPEIGVNGPEIDLDGPNSDVSNGEFNMGGPKGDSFRPETEFSGPNIDLRGPKAGASSVSGPGPDLSTGNIKDAKVHLDAPSAEIDLPSRKKRMGGNCFSCAGGADKDVPYGKKAVDANVDLKGSDAGVAGPKLDTSRPTVGVSGPGIDYSGPNADLPKGDFNIKGPKGDFSGPEFDVNRPKAGFSGPEIDPSGPSADGPDRDFHIKGPKGDFSGPEFEASRFKAGVSRPEIDLSGPSADVSKGDFNVRGPKGDFSGPEFDACRPEIGVNGPEIDLSGPNSGVSNGEINIKGPKGEFSRSELDSLRPETEFSGPNINFRGPKAGPSVKEPNMELTGKPKISGPGLDVSTRNIKDPKVHLDAPSAEIDLPSRKKRMGGNCFSCAGGADKDVPYGKKAVDANVDLKGSDAGVSGPKLDTSRPKVGVSGPGIDYSGPSADLPKGEFNIKGPKGDFSGPEFDAIRPKAGFSGSEIDVSGPRADAPDRDFNIKGPKGDFSGPEFDANRPKAGFSGPEIDPSGPSADIPDRDFHIKRPKGDFSGPEFEASRFKAEVSRPEIDLSGPSADVSKKDFNVMGPKGDFSGPEFDACRPEIGVNGPEIDLSGPNSGVSNGEINIKGPKGEFSRSELDSLRPETEFSGPNIDFRGPKAGASVKEPNMELTGKPKVSGPGLDVSTGNIKDPTVNLDAPSAELDLPSRKKRMGGNCFSCAGGADKDLPYGKKRVDANVDLKGPHADFSAPELNTSRPKVGGLGPGIDLSGPSADIFKGDVNITRPKGDFSGPEFDASRPKTGVSEPEIDVSGLSADISKADFDVRGPKGDYSGLDVDASRPNPGLPGPHLELSGPSADISKGDFNTGGPKANLSRPEFDTSYPKAGVSGPKVSAGRSSTDFSGPKLDVSGLKADLSVEKPKVSGPDLDASIGKVEDPEVNVNSPSADLDFPCRKKRKSVNCLSCTGGVDKDAPYGKKAMDANIDLEGPNGKNRDGEFELGHPEFDGKFGAKKAGSFDLHGPNIDSEDLAMKINTPDFDLRSNKPNSSFQTPDLDVKAGNKGEIDISLPNVTHEKPELSGTFTGVQDKDIELRSPGLDINSSQGSADWGISGSNLPDAPRVAINKPSISGGDLDADAEVPGLRISGSKPSSELDTNALDNNTDVPKSDLRFGISKPDLDTKAELPDLEISAPKPQFGGEEFDMDNSEPEIPTNDFNFDPSLPGIGRGVGGLDKNMRTGEYLDIDINRPDINEYDMDIPKPKIETGDVSLEGSLPELDTSAESPAIGLDDRQLDINVWQPTQDILAPKTLDSPEPNGGWSFQPGGKDYDTNFDWSVNTSTPKQKGSNLAKLELETEPLAVVNDSNLELQSTPTKFPSMDYEEPRNLQRYDEIRPDMELRLLSPKKTDYPKPGFEFENSEGSIDVGKDGIERKPGRMSLVKVEENVTICSASLEEDEPPAPRKRTLTLDREVRQKIEVVFPGEEGSDTKQKGSSSSSSSSSSESEDNKEKTEKRKKKSRLFKAFRKSSTSSASSKEDETPKQKEKERKSSTSSSASEDEKEGKKKPSKGDLAMGITTQIKPKKRKSSGSSSSSDNKTGKKRSVKQKDSKQHKTSTSSTSSSDEDHSKKTNFPISSEYPSAPVKYNVEYTTLPEQYLVSANAGGPKKPESSVPTVVSHIRDDKSKHEERKSSTSSSSDESIPKHKTSPKDPQPSMLYKVEYFTNQQKYIIEPHDEFDKPELSAAEVQEDALKVEFHSVKPEDTKFSFIESKERKSSTSSLSSEKGASDVQEVDLKMESPSIEVKDPSANERKSSTTSTSSEESGRLSPNLGVSVQRHETVHHVSTPDHFSINQVDVPAVTEDPLVIVTRSFKRPVPENDEEGATEHSKVQLNEPPVTLAYHLQYTHNIRMGMEDNDNQVQEEGIAPVVRSRSVEYEVPDLSIVLQPEDDHSFKANERKSSTTSTSSEESGRLSPNLGVSVQRHETVHHVSTPDHFSINQVDVPAVTEDPLVIVTRSFKRPVPENDEEGATEHSKVQLNEPPVTLAYHLQYTHNIRMGMEDNDNQVQEEGIAPVVRSRSVEYEVPDLSIVLQPEDDHSFKANERKSSTTSTSSEESGRLSPNLGVSVQRHETVHHVSTPDHFSINQVDVPAVTEDPLVIVTRSFKRPVPENDEEGATEHSKVQLNEPPVTLAYHLQYTHNIRMGMEDNDNQVQEEGIAPVVRSRSVEYEVPDLSVVLQPEDGHSKDEEKAENRVPTDEKDRASPTMNIQAHTFETVYEVNIPERPTTDNYELEIQEHSPVVVLRSVKRISSEHNDMEEDTQILTSNADVQLSEPSNDVQLDYPEGWGVSTTDDYHLPRAEEEWIVKHSVKKDKPDITSLAGSLDFPENKNQPKAESNQDKDASVKSPREASSVRRNSNSRLWDLMQGYLIERPIVDDDDDDDKDSTPDPEKTTEVKNEGDSKPEKPERSVFNFTIQPVKFDTVDVQVQANDSKEPAKKLTTSFTQVEVDVPKETPPVSQFDIIAVKPDVKEQHTELTTAPVPKVESVIPKARSSVSQFEPVAIQLDVGGKQPIVKDSRSSWRKEASLPSDADDNESDPWMRHYSKGLHQRGHHQPSTSKFTEKESTVPERPGLSLSKVPHVKGVRTSSEHQRERPRYSIDGRARIEPASFPSVTNRSQPGTSRQEPSNRPSVSSLRSFWDK